MTNIRVVRVVISAAISHYIPRNNTRTYCPSSIIACSQLLRSGLFTSACPEAVSHLEIYSITACASLRKEVQTDRDSELSPGLWRPATSYNPSQLSQVSTEPENLLKNRGPPPTCDVQRHLRQTPCRLMVTAEQNLLVAYQPHVPVL